MSTSQSTVDYILDQTTAAGVMSARKMFGEYGLYCNGKLVGLVCDDTLFPKSPHRARRMRVRITPRVLPIKVQNPRC